MLPDFRVTGRWIRVATLTNEWYEDLPDPAAAAEALRRDPRGPDLLSFIQRPPETGRSCPYHVEMDHVAAIPISTFENWFEKQVIKKVRKNVRRSQKYGVTVRRVEFNDDLVRGILEIYREVPMRSGRPFRHYNDDFETCKRKYATFLDRSVFLGAYHEERLIGFIKMVIAGKTGRTMQFISLDEYRDFSPANALLAEAVKTCVAEGLQYLVYGKLTYGNAGNAGLEEFKRANGFQRLEYPRYYVPLTRLGRFALATGLHRDLIDLLPAGLLRLARAARTRYYLLRHAPQMQAHEKRVRTAQQQSTETAKCLPGA